VIKYNHIIKPTAKSAVDFKWFDCLMKLICKIHGAYGFFAAAYHRRYTPLSIKVTIIV